MKNHDLVIVGGGPAGMAAALSARQNGIENILIIERDIELGGILNQCIHNGFGLHHFKKELTGPEYSDLVIKEVLKNNIDHLTNTTVLKLEDRTIHAINSKDGYIKIDAKAIVLAMGCRERTRGAIRIHGSRPAGVYTAGTAQRLVNIDGFLPGKKIVILGSGDIGLITARRMMIKGAKVEAVLEILPYSNGLTRNIVQCLKDFTIPLLLQTTITKIHGNERVEGVTVASVDDNLKPIKSTEKFISCDTVLLSVGLIPENEISKKAKIDIDQKTRGPIVGELRQTHKNGVFACGNVLQVHDLVDFVSEEGALAGLGAAKYIKGEFDFGFSHITKPTDSISYIVPQKINLKNINDKVKLFMRVKNIFRNSIINVYIGNQIIAHKKEIRFLPAELISIEIDKKAILNNPGKELVVKIEQLGQCSLNKINKPADLNCICCPLGCDLNVIKKENEYVVIGNKCPRGKKYAIEEMTLPKRVITNTMKIEGGLYPVIPVKTDKTVPGKKIFDIVNIIANNKVKAPIAVGDIIIKNVADTGANIVASKTDYGKK